MRVLHCRVENFGKLSKTFYDFTQGTNAILADNGWGKSTLAAFIKAMLYGLQNDRKRTGQANERTRFAPWNGGVFGGELQFEAGGKEYVVRRTFATRGNEDTFQLYDKQTMLESNDFSENLGVELFHLDAESFVRTIFLTQNDCQAGITDSVSAKLGNITDSQNDMDRYNGADAAIKGLTDRMSPKRKTGSIASDKVRLSELDVVLRDGKNLDITMKQIEEKRALLEEKREALKKEREILEQNQAELSIYTDLKGKKEAYEGLTSQVQERQTAYDACRSYFPGECPKKQELDEAKKAWNQTQMNRRDMDNACLSEEEKEKLSEYQRIFAKGIPSDEELEQALATVKKKEELEKEAAALKMAKEDIEKLHLLEEKYQEKMPDEAVLVTMKEQHRSLQEKAQSKQNLESAIHIEEDHQRVLREIRKAEEKKPFPVVTYLIIALLMLVISGVCFAMNQGMNAVLFCVVAIVCGILFVIGKAKGKPPVVVEEEEPWELVQKREELSKVEKALQEGQSILDAFCESYGFFYDSNSFLEHLAAMQSDCVRYKELSARYNKLAESGIEDALLTQKEALQGFAGTYQDALGDGPVDGMAITALKDKTEKYDALIRKQSRYETLQKNYTESLEKRQVFFTTFGFEEPVDGTAFLEEVTEKLTALQNAKEELDRVTKSKEQFEAENECQRLQHLEEPQTKQTMEEVALLLKENADCAEQTSKDIQGYDVQLGELQEKLEEYQLVEEKRGELDEKIKADTKTWELLAKTRELLDKAKTSFTAKYTEPVMSGFRKYYKLVSNAESDAFTLDANMKLTYLSENAQREIVTESAGNQDMIGVCLRLALVDAMYKEEKPFLILDDPFVNLDKAKTEGALQFLEEIAKEYQVLYFACHESRIRK